MLAHGHPPPPARPARAKPVAGYPRLSIDLDVVAENTLLLAARLLGDGFTLVGVTKCVDGEPRVGQAMLEAGCAGLGDSRLPSLARLAAASLGPLTLIRAPQPDELATAARVAPVSYTHLT